MGRRRWIAVRIAALACAVHVTGAHAQSPDTEAGRFALIGRMVEQIRAEYPDVPTITALSLRQALPTADFLLVDVRSEAEQAVSTLPGAITADEFEARMAEFGRSGRTLVAYCTIGARSSAYVRRMRQRGIDMVNLEGSVLAWTHAGGMLTDGDLPTRRLHVFGRRWNLAADGYETVW